jgi:hypothetical protein
MGYLHADGIILKRDIEIWPVSLARYSVHCRPLVHTSWLYAGYVLTSTANISFSISLLRHKHDLDAQTSRSCVYSGWISKQESVTSRQTASPFLLRSPCWGLWPDSSLCAQILWRTILGHSVQTRTANCLLDPQSLWGTPSHSKGSFASSYEESLLGLGWGFQRKWKSMLQARAKQASIPKYGFFISTSPRYCFDTVPSSWGDKIVDWCFLFC